MPALAHSGTTSYVISIRIASIRIASIRIASIQHRLDSRHFDSHHSTSPISRLTTPRFSIALIRVILIHITLPRQFHALPHDSIEEMPSEQVDLTPERLIGLATETLRGFATTTILSQEESNTIKTCTKCIALDSASFGRNTNKKRAHAILTNIWQQSPALFVVVALSSTVTQLGTMKSKDYLRVLLTWWTSLNRPDGFQDQEVLHRHLSILPPISLAQPMTSKLQREDFILFLQTNPRAIGPFEIFIPEHGRPYVELSSEMCQDLILVAMDRTQRREC